ncbi:hypothetical protein BAUCODRAFT_120371 [Baudoinia panamericana UAMH 10762]|uniref:Uncharacterized protein n=1 Tax=Baudoinia panamericana (strain UAMH 10762) TaxID=717646 RepID=M2NI91_BAUPA|nr:uncharacterized protein BAUCODRAFT_120371 [Baudoinia panamericana UAMH 10762]EMC99079.1 hypothetical protein BAUCODRAFT_120371 [Baudoinia panamericana UAMH 10762]
MSPVTVMQIKDYQATLDSLFASPTERAVVIGKMSEARPGPNAFAQQAARAERHRLAGNAFYQQEMERRRVTPPGAVHPALRSHSALGIDMPGPRESTVTTMPPFLNSGREPSPPLKLVPGIEAGILPTRRGVIEERREQMLHEASGVGEGRTPVYQTFAPTPKPLSSEFAQSGKPATPHKSRLSLPKKGTTAGNNDQLPKSPKRNFFDKLRMTKLNGSTPSPSMSTLGSTEGLRVEQDMPVKAQAVLGASHSKANLTRSPSKQKKGIFAARKNTQMPNVNTSGFVSGGRPSSAKSEGAPQSASTVTKTPQTAYSDPAHYSFQGGKHVTSHTLSQISTRSENEVRKCAVQRTQSLKYFDCVVPPTPPAKNTPPSQKAQETAAAGSKSTRVPFHQTMESEGVVSTSARLSPTKFGSYGRKETPALVTRPSIYSMHASVIPEVMEASAFEDMKSRLDGLGLEGFSMPGETHHRHPEMEYSPSVYSGDWTNRSSVVWTPRQRQRFSMNELPSVAETPASNGHAGHQAKESTSSGESKESKKTIEVFYPDLLKDTSMQHPRPESVLEAGDARNREFRADTTLHGRTHSRDYSSSPRQSTDASLFAMPVDPSPASFSHHSAMPSPLHYLPATVYTPPPKASRKHNTTATKKRSDSVSPSRGESLLQNAPLLQATSKAIMRPIFRTAAGRLPEGAENVDPAKSGIRHSNSDKQEQIVEMLNTLIARNTDMAAMREELRAANARLDARLAAVETMHRSSPSPNASCIELDGPEHGVDIINRDSQIRVPTDTAHAFYKLGQSSDTPSSPPASLAGAGSDELAQTEAKKIMVLEKENRQLQELMARFAADMEQMKRMLADRQ